MEGQQRLKCQLRNENYEREGLFNRYATQHKVKS